MARLGFLLAAGVFGGFAVGIGVQNFFVGLFSGLAIAAILACLSVSD